MCPQNRTHQRDAHTLRDQPPAQRRNFTQRGQPGEWGTASIGRGLPPLAAQQHPISAETPTTPALPPLRRYLRLNARSEIAQLALLPTADPRLIRQRLFSTPKPTHSLHQDGQPKNAPPKTPQNADMKTPRTSLMQACLFRLVGFRTVNQGTGTLRAACRKWAGRNFDGGWVGGVVVHQKNEVR